jgi:GNAT superfamily N-acetyltransferase
MKGFLDILPALFGVLILLAGLCPAVGFIADQLFRARRSPRMWRSLSDLPPLRVPAGYRLRDHRCGDERSWVRLVKAAFATEKGVPVRVSGAAFEGERGRTLFIEREADGELAGTVALLGDWFKGWPVGLVEWLAVHPAHRRRGLGEALVVAALHDLKKRGQSEALLEAHPSLAAAARLYARLGFTPVGERQQNNAAPPIRRSQT